MTVVTRVQGAANSRHWLVNTTHTGLWLVTGLWCRIKFHGLHKPAEMAFLGKKVRWAPAPGLVTKPSVLWVMSPPPSTLHKWQEDGDFNAVTHTNNWRVLTQAQALGRGTQRAVKKRQNLQTSPSFCTGLQSVNRTVLTLWALGFCSFLLCTFWLFICGEPVEIWLWQSRASGGGTLLGRCDRKASFSNFLLFLSSQLRAMHAYLHVKLL